MSVGRFVATSFGVLLISAPLAVAISFLMIPVWKWLEAEHGLEAYGHSGPAGWCYLAAHVGCVALLSSTFLIIIKRRAAKT